MFVGSNSKWFWWAEGKLIVFVSPVCVRLAGGGAARLCNRMWVPWVRGSTRAACMAS